MLLQDYAGVVSAWSSGDCLVSFIYRGSVSQIRFVFFFPKNLHQFKKLGFFQII